jgi:hypothetical protein
MDEATKEHIIIALAAGVVTFVVTFATMHYINPTIKNAIK